MDLSDTTRTIVIGVSVGIGSFAVVLGLVITCLICRRRRRNHERQRQKESRGVRYDKRPVRPYGPPGAPSAGSSSGKAYKHRVRAAATSTDNTPRRVGDMNGHHYPGYPTMDSQHQQRQASHPRTRGGAAGGGDGPYGRTDVWHSLHSGNPAPGFKSNSLPGASELSFPRYETRLANRHRDEFGYTGRTVSEPYDQQSMDAKWQDNWPGRPRQLGGGRGGGGGGDDSWPRHHYPDNISFDSRSVNSFNLYHHRLYGGRDFPGAGFMSQSIDKSLNGLQQSSQSLYYDGRR